jgi:hypothetical protein
MSEASPVNHHRGVYHQGDDGTHVDDGDVRRTNSNLCGSHSTKCRSAPDTRLCVVTTGVPMLVLSVPVLLAKAGDNPSR